MISVSDGDRKLYSKLNYKNSSQKWSENLLIMSRFMIDLFYDTRDLIIFLSFPFVMLPQQVKEHYLYQG